MLPPKKTRSKVKPPAETRPDGPGDAQGIYELLVDSVRDYAILLLDPSGHIRSWNKGAEFIKGYKAQEIIGRHFSIFYTDQDRADGLPLHLLNIAAETGSAHDTGWRVRMDGSLLWADVTISALYGPGREVIGFSKVTRDMTAQRRIEEEKSKIERVLDSTNELARIGAWEIDIASNTLTMSRVNKMIRELPEDYETDPRDGRDYFKEGEHRDRVQQALERALKEGKPYDLEVILMTARGREVWVRVIGQPEFRDGKCVRVYGMLQDIDAQKRTQISLQLREEQFRHSFELSGIGMALVSPDQHFIEVNSRLAGMLGYTREELRGMSAQDISHPDDAVLSDDYARQVLEGDLDHFQMTKRYFHRNGSTIWVSIHVSLVRNLQGQPVHFVSEIEDVTAQRRAETEKQKIQRVLDATSEAARIGAWEIDLSTNSLVLSRVNRLIRGIGDEVQLTPETGRLFFMEGEHRDRVQRAFVQAITEGIPYDLETLCVTASGREIWVRVIGQPEFRDGKCIRVFGMLQDIDQQKRAQISLQLSEEHFRRSFDLAGIGMALTSLEERFVRVNKRFCDILGYTEQEFYAMSWADITYPGDLDAYTGRVRQLHEGTVEYFEMTKRYLHKNGSVVWAHVNVSLIRDEMRQPVHFVTQMEDITLRKKLEEESTKVSQIIRNMGEIARIGAWEIDLSTQKIIWSPVARLIHEVGEDFEPDMTVGMAFYKDQDSLERADHAFRQAVAHGTPFDIEVLQVTATGRDIWCRLIGHAELSDGRCTRVYGIIQDIDEQKRTQLRLELSEEQFRSSFELSGIGMALIAISGRIISANKRLIGLLGYEGDDIYARSAFDITHPDDIDDEVAYARQLLAGEIDHYQKPKRFVSRTGSTIWANVTVTLVRDEQKKPVHFLMEAEDLSEKKKIEQLLDSTNEAARIGAWEADLVNNKLIWSRVTRSIHEVDDDYQPDLAGAIAFFKEGESRDIMQAVFDEAARNGTPYDVEVLLVTAKGREIWCRSIANTEFRDGKCLRVYGIFQDIDFQKRTQIELQLSEEQFRKSFDLSGMGMALLSVKGTVIRVNKRLCELLGYTIDELSLMNTVQVTHPDDVAEDVRLGWQLLEGEIDYYHRTKRFINKNGSVVWAHVTLSLVRDAQGRAVHFVCEVEDITEVKKAADELKRVNEELTAIFDSGIRVSIITSGLDGIITHFNRGSEELFGYKAEEVVGKMTPVILHPAEENLKQASELSEKLNRQIKGFGALVETARLEGFESKESTYLRKDGSTFTGHAVISPIRDTQQNITGFLGITTDITHIKEAEAAARKYALLEAKNKEMEQFTFIASHDLLEPLQTVSSFVGLLSEEYLDQLDEDARKYLNFISGSTRRMMELVKGLLHYSRLGKERKLEIVDCNVLIREVMEDLGLRISENKAQIQVSYLPIMEAFPIELKQLFQNLIINAIKFRKPDVPLEIRISARFVNDKWTFVVADNGIGIAERNQEKIFMIFQRLHDRHEYEGTGIGLAYCKKIVEMHGGTIWVESRPGEGSSFYFTLMQ